MFYRLHPSEPIRWSDQLNGKLYQFMIENDVSLDRLKWDVSERELSSPLIELALRYGTPDEKAIYLDWHKVGVLGALEGAESAYADMRTMREQNPAVFPEEEWNQMDSLYRSLIKDHQAEYQQLLDNPVRENLKELWKSLGGYYQG